MKSTMNFRRIQGEQQRQEKRPKKMRKRRRRRQRFLYKQFLTLTETLQDTAKALHALAPVSPANRPSQESNEPDVLSVLYSGAYFPKSHRSIKDDPLDKNAHKTLEALRATFSPEQGELFLQYEAAENMRGAGISERAYKAGFRLAVQLILAGRLDSAETE